MPRNIVAVLIAASIGLGFSAQAMAENGRQTRQDGRDWSRSDRSDQRHHGWQQGQHNGWRDRNHDGRVDWRDQPGHVQPGHNVRDRNHDGRVDWRDWNLAR